MRRGKYEGKPVAISNHVNVLRVLAKGLLIMELALSEYLYRNTVIAGDAAATTAQKAKQACPVVSIVEHSDLLEWK